MDIMPLQKLPHNTYTHISVPPCMCLLDIFVNFCAQMTTDEIKQAMASEGKN